MTLYQNWRDVPKGKWRWSYFSPREIACKGTGRVLIDEVAMDRLQALRLGLGRPIILTSAYRSPEHNRNVNGAKNSYHMKGIAFDCRMDNHDPQIFELAAREAGFRGIGYYPKSGFIHIDTGPERTWGTPFPRSATQLPAETVQVPERAKATQSTTLQAGAVQVTTGAVGAATAVAALDGTAQYIAIGFAGVIILAALWIMRERLRRWGS